MGVGLCNSLYTLYKGYVYHNYYNIMVIILFVQSPWANYAKKLNSGADMLVTSSYTSAQNVKVRKLQ